MVGKHPGQPVAKAVATATCNTNFEGEAKFAKSVKITNFTPPTVNTYTPYNDITVEEVADTGQTLPIDQYAYAAQQLDDVDKAQSVAGGKIMNHQTQQMGEQLADALDQNVFQEMGDNGTAVAEQTVSTAAGAYDLLVDFYVQLDEANVPESGRFAVVTPAFYGLILKDERFVGTGDGPAAATRKNGVVGEAAGFRIHKSNNLADGGSTGKKMLLGTTAATTLAEQVDTVEATRKELRFADQLRALHVYGRKVILPEALLAADIVVS